MISGLWVCDEARVLLGNRQETTGRRVVWEKAAHTLGSLDDAVSLAVMIRPVYH